METIWGESWWWSLGDFRGLSRNWRKVGPTRVAAEGAAGAIQTKLRSPRGSGLRNGGQSSKADAGGD